MGNKLSTNSAIQQQEQSPQIRETQFLIEQNSPEKLWHRSQKKVGDLQVLIRSCDNWPQVIRPFLRKITNKHLYQTFLRAILQQILEKSFFALQEQKDNQVKKSQFDKVEIEEKPDQNASTKGKNTQDSGLNMNANHSNRKQIIQLFKLYKKRLEQSYFVMNTQKGVIETEFQQSLKQIWSLDSRQTQSQKGIQSNNFNSYLETEQSFKRLIPSLMVSQLYQYSSLKQNYMNEVFIELNIKVYDSLQEFARQLIQEFIVVEDQFNLTKFVVSHEILLQSLSYLETCAKILPQSQKQTVFQEIKRLKKNPTLHYIKMCHIFLRYKNVYIAELIIHNLIEKGYHLSEQQTKFYFYILTYKVFLYEANFSPSISIDFNQKSHLNRGEQVQHQGSFISFQQGFQRFTIEQIFHNFLSLQPFAEINRIKRCFEIAFSLKDPKKGQKMFIKHLKQYALGSRSDLIIAIEAMKNHLISIQQDQREELQFLFLQKLSTQFNIDIIDYQRDVIDMAKLHNFSKEVFNFLKIVFKVSSILKKFEISSRLSEIYQFMFHNKRLNTLRKIKQKVMSEKMHEKSPQELQFMALVTIKQIITKYLILSRSKEQVVFIIQDKFDQQCLQYSIKEIESLFILTEYLHRNLFQTFVPLQQLHQLLFQHMLYFNKYDKVEIMLRQQNLSRYFIQQQVVKMLILENIRETLIKSQKSISSLSQEIKKQLKILQNHFKHFKKVLDVEFTQDQTNMQINRNSFQLSQLQQIESIQALFKLLIKLDFYSVSLTQQQKQNIGINILYFLIEHYPDQIQVFDYDHLYRLILLAQARNLPYIHQTLKNTYQNLQNNHQVIPVTNQYLKFKIDLAHKAFEKGKIKFGEHILKQVIEYQPPWISSEIIKIIRKSPQTAAINQSFMNIAFQYCMKGEDLVYLLKIFKKKTQQKEKKTGQKITELFQSTKKFIVTDDSYIKDEKQYRNLIGQMCFNDESLKSQDYDLFFTLLGTQPERAFYHIYNKSLDLVKIEIILKQGMKVSILNILNIIRIFFKLLFFSTMRQVDKRKQSPNLYQTKISFLKFKNSSIDDILRQIQSTKILASQEINKSLEKQIPYIMLKKIYKILRSLLILPPQFIQNYLENFSFISHQDDHNQLLYTFCFDQNYREKHLIALKDQPMGKNDIKIYKQLCQINGLNIMQLTIFNLTNQLNAIEISSVQKLLEQQKMQNVIQKIVTWTQNNPPLIHELLSKLCSNIFSSEILYNILRSLSDRQNLQIGKIISEQHMQIIESLKQIEVNTQLHGIITDQFFSKPIGFNPKHKLSEKHIKILRKELKLRNVFVISKILYFCYGMSNDVQKQVFKIFIKENENEQQIEIFQQLKKKIQDSEN